MSQALIFSRKSVDPGTLVPRNQHLNVPDNPTLQALQLSRHSNTSGTPTLQALPNFKYSRHKYQNHPHFFFLLLMFLVSFFPIFSACVYDVVCMNILLFYGKKFLINHTANDIYCVSCSSTKIAKFVTSLWKWHYCVARWRHSNEVLCSSYFWVSC